MVKNLETPARLEPCGLEEVVPKRLEDLVLEIEKAAGTIGRWLPFHLLPRVRHVMQVANAYHSNFIEGHLARAQDIEASLLGSSSDQRHSVMRRPLSEANEVRYVGLIERMP